MALKDYNRGRSYLSDLANREGIPVFGEVKEAVECVIQRCQAQHKQLQQLKHKQQQHHHKQQQQQQQQRWWFPIDFKHLPEHEMKSDESDLSSLLTLIEFNSIPERCWKTLMMMMMMMMNNVDCNWYYWIIWMIKFFFLNTIKAKTTMKNSVISI